MLKMSKKVACLNMNGFGSLVRDHPMNKWGKINRMMTDRKIAVLMLQETHLTEERKQTIERMYSQRLKIFHSPDPTDPTQRSGVAIVINTRLAMIDDAKMTVVDPGRALHLQLKWSMGEERAFLAVYAPSNGAAERSDFFTRVREYFEKYTHLRRPDVMGGDFNMVEDMIDRLPMRRNGAVDQEPFDELKRTLRLKLTDGWRATFPDTRAYTFMQQRQDGPHLARLDRLYCNEKTFEKARQWQIQEPGVKTDHSLVLVQVTCEETPAVGKGRAKLSEWVMKDKAFKTYVRDRGIFAMNELKFLQEVEIRSETRNPVQVLREFCEDVFTMGRERERTLIPAAQKKIKALTSEIARVSKDTRVSEKTRATEIAALKAQVRKAEVGRYIQQKANARAKHRVEGEIPTAYWVNLFKTQKPRDVMFALEVEGQTNATGDPIFEKDSHRMAEMARQYHWHLQDDDNSDPNWKPPEEREEAIQTALDALDARVTADQAEEMGAFISYEEVEMALHFAKNKSAPGLDGIPYEFWKIVNDRFKEDSKYEDRPKFDGIQLLLEAFKDIQRHGLAEGSHFADGWMCPLYKKNERTKISNYRPITLLNTTYKLLTKVLSLRL
ncbi:Endonuclease/exonuclease/phosphatase, partial [Schizophyllum commune]